MLTTPYTPATLKLCSQVGGITLQIWMQAGKLTALHTLVGEAVLTVWIHYPAGLAAGDCLNTEGYTHHTPHH